MATVQALHGGGDVEVDPIPNAALVALKGKMEEAATDEELIACLSDISDLLSVYPQCREKWRKLQLTEKVVNLMESENRQLQLRAISVVWAASFEHPRNKQAFVNAKACDSLVKIVETEPPESDLLVFVAGALRNLSAGCSTACSALLNLGGHAAMWGKLSKCSLEVPHSLSFMLEGLGFLANFVADEQKGSSALDSAGVVMGLTELAASNLSETPVVVGVLRVLQSLHVDGLTPPTLVGLSSFAKSLKDQMDSLPEELQVELKLFSPTSYTSELRWEMLPTCGSVSEDGHTLTQSGSGSGGTYRMQMLFKSGVHKFRFLCKHINTNMWYPGVGFCTESFSSWGSWLKESQHGWVYEFKEGHNGHGGSRSPYGAPVRDGDEIEMTLDFKKGHVRFSRNGADQGVFIHNLTFPVYPAASTYSTEDSIVFLSHEQVEA